MDNILLDPAVTTVARFVGTIRLIIPRVRARGIQKYMLTF